MNQHQNKNSNSLRFAFFGTPELACKTLDILSIHGSTPTLLVTTVDRASGRGMHMQSSPIALWAQSHNIPCLKPEKIDDDFMNTFKTFDIDLSIVVAYGKIIPEILINTPSLGTINIHYSLLPKYRGASPLEQALLNGDSFTGVSIQQMAYKLDSGPILASKQIEITIDENKDTLREILIKTGAELLCDILPDIIEQKTKPQTQDEANASYCTKIKKEDGEIKLADDPHKNYNKYRAFTGWPGTYFFVEKNNKKIRIKITEARFDNGIFVIEKVVPEGKKEITYEQLTANYIHHD